MNAPVLREGTAVEAGFDPARLDRIRERAASWVADGLTPSLVLVAARHIYRKNGYRLVETEPHHSFGRDLIGETWELDLAAASRPAGKENTERTMD